MFQSGLEFSQIIMVAAPSFHNTTARALSRVLNITDLWPSNIQADIMMQ